MTPVHITRLEAQAVSLPLRKPMKMAGIDLTTAENLVVKITASDGAIGWGEAASAPSMTGETVQGMVAAVRHLAPFLNSMPVDALDRIDREAAWRVHGNHAAKNAIDMALLDLQGRRQGIPVHALLGRAQRERLPVLWLIGTGRLETDLAEASARHREGFTAFKIKVGVDTPRADAERTLALCDALGDAVLRCADANQGFDEPGAIEYMRAVEHSGIDFVEQPVAAADLAAMARVAAASGVAIGADEGIHDESDIRRHHEMHAAEGCSLKLIKLGGLRATLRAGQLCQSLGMHVNLAAKIAESSIASAALLHVAALLPALDWGVSPSSHYLAEDLAHAPLRIDGGQVQVPPGPGLGIEVDEHRIAAFQRHV